MITYFHDGTGFRDCLPAYFALSTKSLIAACYERGTVHIKLIREFMHRFYPID